LITKLEQFDYEVEQLFHLKKVFKNIM